MKKKKKYVQSLFSCFQQVAENLTDELVRADCREIRLEEDEQLAVTFVQPEEGFSYEVARGVPPGLIEFIQPLQQAGMCRLSLHSNASGLWTVYFLPNVSICYIYDGQIVFFFFTNIKYLSGSKS